MNRQSQTKRRIWTAVKLAAGLILLAAIAGAVLLLERDRSRRLLAEDAKLWTTEDGIIRGVEFLVPIVSSDHWSLLEGSTDALVAVNLKFTWQVAGGLAPLAKYPNVRELRLAECRWIDDAQAVSIAKRHRLRLLDISGTQLTDAGIQEFDLIELNTFKADRCTGLTAETLRLLGTLPSLKTVSLKAVPIPFDRYEQFRIARPDVVIDADPVLTWQQVDLPSLSLRQVNWVSDDTDVDQFVRYSKLREDWPLRRLTLGGPGVSRTLPGILPNMSELEWLAIVDTKLDGGLEALPSTVHTLTLTQLHPGSTLGDLESVTELRSIDARHIVLESASSSALFQLIAANKALNRLILTGVEVPAGAFRELHGLRELKLLGLYNTQVTDADLQSIGQITSLETLDTNGFPISDAVVESWLQLPNLTYIDAPGDAISPETQERLRQRYPQAHIRLH